MFIAFLSGRIILLINLSVSKKNLQNMKPVLSAQVSYCIHTLRVQQLIYMCLAFIIGRNHVLSINPSISRK